MADQKRLPNFTYSERSLLIKLANCEKSTIENKKTDAIMWKEKETAWEKLTKKFNSCTTGPPRTSKQLIDKYKSIKKELKKAHTSYKNYTTGTGGGPYKEPPIPSSEEERELIETIKLSIIGIQNSYDSDGLCGISGMSTSQILDKESENIVQEIDVDWGRGTATLWQTPKHPKLKAHASKTSEKYLSDTDQIVNGIEKSLEKSDVEEEDKITPIVKEIIPEWKLGETTDKESKITKSWTSRRRPLILKKKSVTSVAAKFEVVAEKKLQLIDLQVNAINERSLQDQKEHELRMQLLQVKMKNEKMKTAILEKGSVVVEF